MSAEWGKISSEEILAAVKGRMVSGDPHGCFSGFNSDSRATGQGEIFWALKGDRFDGHDFVSRAVRQGATGVVVQKGFQVPLEKASHTVVIEVDDTLRALGNLAAWWRRQHNTKVAALTGSSGKTTTKEMTAAILEVGNRTLKNPGNHNNLIGLPVTLLKLEKTHERAVLEMGMSHKGEIARLTEIADPHVAAILNVGMAHLEGLGDIDGVAEAKTEMMEKLSPEAKIVLNGDDGVLMKHAARFNRESVTFGLAEGSHIRGVNIQDRGPEGLGFDLTVDGHTWPVNLSISGAHNVKNALAAAAIGWCLGESPEHIVSGLGAFQGIKGRFQNIPLEKDILLIDDTYNANPSALKAALHSAAAMVQKNGRFIVGLGDMLELGETAVTAHLEAGSGVAASGASWFFAMGSRAEDMKRGAVAAGMPLNRIIIVENHDELIRELIQKMKSNDTVLLKGSRKMQFEKVSEGLQSHFGLRSPDMQGRTCVFPHGKKGKDDMKKPIKVLVVDDEKGIRFLLSEALLHRGFEVSLARDGQESLEKMEKSNFDLVVTDINMPRLDGVKMLKSMRETGRAEKIIIMTGNPSDQRLMDEGMPPVVTRLSKPFGIDKFLDVVVAATTRTKDAVPKNQAHADPYM